MTLSNVAGGAALFRRLPYPLRPRGTRSKQRDKRAHDLNLRTYPRRRVTLRAFFWVAEPISGRLSRII